MSNHFRRNYDTLSEIFLDKVINGGSLASEISRLKETAKDYLKRAKIAENANIAYHMNIAWQKLSTDYTKNEDAVSVLMKVESKLYDITHDDLFIVAAFENYAKSILLSKKRVVHTIKKPHNLNKDQKNNPIHINTIRSLKILPSLWLEHHTIGMNQLLQPGYISLLNISEKAAYAIRRCKTIRNQIHFGGPQIIGYGTAFYEGLIDLRKTILG